MRTSIGMDIQIGGADKCRFNGELVPRQQDTFSVIVLVYNNASYLPDVLRSICEQEYDNLEIIVSDDHSMDFNAQAVHDLVQRFNRGQRIDLIVTRNGENLGTVKNANQALEISSGQFIKLIGADDALNGRGALSEAHSFFSTTELRLFECRVVECDAQLQPQDMIAKRSRDYQNGILNVRDAKRLVYKNSVHAAGVFFRRSFFDKWGLFDERYRLLEDWPTWLRVTRQGERIAFLDASLVKYRNDVGVATSINPFFIADRRTCYANEIKPHAAFYGVFRCAFAAVLCRLYTSVMIRKAYALLVGRKPFSSQ